MSKQYGYQSIEGNVQIKPLASTQDNYVGVDLNGELKIMTNPSATDIYVNAAYFNDLANSGLGILRLKRSNNTNVDVNLDGRYSLLGHNHSLDSLSNVNTTGIVSGQSIKWNGTTWIPYTALITETDPIFTGHVAYGITSTLIGNWNTAYSKRVTAIAFSGSATKTLTLTLGDNSTLSATFSDTDTNTFVTSGAFNTGTGLVTLTRNDAATVTFNLDGRYSLTTHSHTWSEILSKPNSGNFIYNQSASAQAADFWISGNGNLGGSLTVANVVNETVDPNKLLVWATDGSVKYMTKSQLGIGAETDPVWTAASVNYYTKTNLQTSGQSAVHWGNITNAPAFLTSLAHNHGVANSTGVQQFTFGVNEIIRFEGGGATSVSFDPATKKVIISSTAGTGADGNTFVTGSTFNHSSGQLSLVRNDSAVVSVNLDGRYSLTGHTHNWSEITNKPTIEQMDVFLIGGQSNTRGNGSATNSPDPSANTVYEYESGTFHQVTDEVGNIGGRGSAWPSFGIQYYNITGRKIAFIQTAVDGSGQTTISDVGYGNWSPSGSLFAASVTKTVSALAAITAAGYTPVFKGILWGQGENDARKINDGSLTASAYQAALTQMIANYRTQFGANMPFYIFQTGTETTASDVGYSAVRTAQQTVSNNLPTLTKIAFKGAIDFPSRGMMQSDGLHYTQSGLNEMGEIGAWNIINNNDRFFQRRNDGRLFYGGGNIGINTQTPSAAFHVFSNSTPALFTGNDNGGNSMVLFENTSNGNGAGAGYRLLNDTGLQGQMFLGSSNCIYGQNTLILHNIFNDLRVGSNNGKFEIVTESILSNNSKMTVWNSGRITMGNNSSAIGDNGVDRLQVSGSVNITTAIKAASATISGLAGTGNRMVVADAGGTLSTMAISASDGNTFVTSGAFNVTSGLVTLTRNDAVTVTFNLDGRYSLSNHTHNWVDILSKPNSGNFIYNTTTKQASSNFNISGNGTIGNQLLVQNASPSNFLNVDMSSGSDYSTFYYASGDVNGGGFATFILSGNAEEGLYVSHGATSFNLSAAQGGVVLQGSMQVSTLSGTGTRMVVADAGGNISTQAVPSFGGTNFIQNQNSAAQTANFWISGNGKLGGSLVLGTVVNETVDPNKLLVWATDGTVKYMTKTQLGIGAETDPVWLSEKPNYYTKTNLQTSGQSAVHWGNITNAPAFLTSLAHNHGVANAAGTQQFTFGVNDNIRFEGGGATSVSFDPATKKITISSTTGAGADGNTFVTSGAFNTASGDITLTRNDSGTVVFNVDGRYSLNTHTHDWSTILNKPNSGNFIYNQNTSAQTADLWISGNGRVQGTTTLDALAGTGVRLVAANATGVLQPITTGSNNNVLRLVSGVPTWAAETVTTQYWQPTALSTNGIIYNAGKIYANKSVDAGAYQFQVGGGIHSDGVIYSTGDITTEAELKLYGTSPAIRFYVGDQNYAIYRSGTSMVMSSTGQLQFRSSNAVFSNADNTVAYGSWDSSGLNVRTNLSLVITPTLSSGSYDVLTRNSATGVVERVAASTLLSGSAGNYIQNQNTTDQTANFRINGNSRIAIPVSTNGAGLFVTTVNPGPGAGVNWSGVSVQMEMDNTTGNTFKLLELKNTGFGGATPNPNGYLLYAEGGANTAISRFIVDQAGGVFIGAATQLPGSFNGASVQLPFYLKTGFSTGTDSWPGFFSVYGTSLGLGAMSMMLENTATFSGGSGQSYRKTGLYINNTGSMTTTDGSSVTNYGILVDAAGAGGTNGRNFGFYARSGDIMAENGNMYIGTTTEGVSTNPKFLSLGSSYSTAAGQNLKVILYDNGNTSNRYGFGISSASLDYAVPNAAAHNFYVNGSNRLQIAEGYVRIPQLAGSGVRMVVADSNGDVSTQSIPVPTGANFIQNQFASAQTANAWLSGQFMAEGQVTLGGYGTGNGYDSVFVKGNGLFVDGRIYSASNNTYLAANSGTVNIGINGSVTGDKLYVNGSVRIDNGHVTLNSATKPWGSVFEGVIESATAAVGFTTYGEMYDTSGLYYNGSWLSLGLGVKPSMYRTYDGTFKWSVGSVVAAGQPVTFTDLMFLNNTGDLSLYAGNVYTPGGNSLQWNTAFSWGDHATAGYLKTYANNLTTAINFDASSGDFTIARNGLGNLLTSIDGRYSLLGHIHDDRYYTETESDAKYSLRAHPAHGNSLSTTDTRSVNDAPSAFTASGLYTDFKAGSTVGLGGSYSSVLTASLWVDDGGGGVHQQAFSDTGRVYNRYGLRSSGWGPWYTFHTTQDFSVDNVQHGETAYTKRISNFALLSGAGAGTKTLRISLADGTNFDASFDDMTGGGTSVGSLTQVTTQGNDTLGNRMIVTYNPPSEDYNTGNLEIKTTNGSSPILGFHRGGVSAVTLLEANGYLYTKRWTGDTTLYRVLNESDGTTTATANKLTLRDGNGDIYSRYSVSSYVNTSDDVSGNAVSYLMGKFGDNYHRSATAAKVQEFLNFERIVQGDNANKTSNVGNINTPLPSGFYDINAGTGAPDSNWWNVLNMRHNNTSNQYGTQMAMRFALNGSPKMMIRVIDGGTATSWAEILTSVNYTNYQSGVTSVGLSASGALTATNTPVTTTGDLNLNWTGNSNQVVLGNGSLATITSLSLNQEYYKASLSTNYPTTDNSVHTILTFTIGPGMWNFQAHVTVVGNGNLCQFRIYDATNAITIASGSGEGTAAYGHTSSTNNLYGVTSATIIQLQVKSLDANMTIAAFNYSGWDNATTMTAVRVANYTP